MKNGILENIKEYKSPYTAPKKGTLTCPGKEEVFLTLEIQTSDLSEVKNHFVSSDGRMFAGVPAGGFVCPIPKKRAIQKNVKQKGTCADNKSECLRKQGPEIMFIER